MKHDKKIKKIKVTVEFDCYGRTGFIEAFVDLHMLSDPINLRLSLDASIEKFLEENKPVRLTKPLHS